MTIKQQQLLLSFLGYYNGKIDGITGPQTQDAIRKFQSCYGLVSDGICGAKTEAKIREVIGNPALEKKQEDTPVVTKPVVSKPVTGDDFWDGIKYFKPEEFQCQCGCGAKNIDHDLVLILEKIREHYGKPVRINSGVRCKTHNARVGGAANSQHLDTYAKAADIGTISGTTPRAMATYVETLMPNTGGIGIYSWGIHIDTRKVKARWNG
jgi:hypothetical protein